MPDKIPGKLISEDHRVHPPCPHFDRLSAPPSLQEGGDERNLGIAGAKRPQSPNSAIPVFLIAAALLTLACLCLPVGAGTPPTAAPGSGSTTPLPIVLEKHPVGPQDIPVCVNRLQRLLALTEKASYGGGELQSEVTLADYTVSGDEIGSPVFPVMALDPGMEAYQEDVASQQKIWQFVTDVIPADRRAEISRFVLFTDGPGNALGTVEQADDDPHLWKFELDMVDAAYFPDFSSTVIHEFAHLLSLNDSQVVTDMELFDNPDDEQTYEADAAACGTYFVSEGCSRPDSYMALFFERFWPDLYDEWTAINVIEDDARREARLSDFYQEYADQFVSEYAATSPEEDLAESFLYFIFSPQPSRNTVSAQKIRFFYEFPELVALRDRILPNLCAYVDMP